MKKLAVIILSSVLILSSFVTSFAVNTPLTNKDETVYASLNYNGSVEEITVVNRLFSSTENKLVDYGTYTNIQNLTNDIAPIITNDMIVFEGVNELYYEGNTKGELPYTVEIKYFLDNKEITGDKLAGAKGKIRIDIKVSPNEKADAAVKEGLMAQISTTLSMDKVKNLAVKNGLYVVAGKSYNVTFVAMGENPSDFSLSFDGTEFEMSSVNINIIKSTFNAEDIIGDTKNQLLDAFDDIADGVQQAKEGTQELQSGTKDISGAVSKLTNGLNTLSNSSEAISSGLDSYTAGLNTFGESMPQLSQGSTAFAEGLNTIAAGMPALLQGYTDLNTGLAELIKGHSQLDSAATTAINDLVPALEQLAPALSELSPALTQSMPLFEQLAAQGLIPQEVVALIGQTATLTTQSAELITNTSAAVSGLSQGVKAETAGLNKLSEGLTAANTQFATVKDGITQLNTNFVQLNNGIQLLPQGVQSLKDGFVQIKNGVLQYTSGVSQIATGANTLNKGTASLPKEVQKLVDGQGEIVDGVKSGKTEVEEQINEFTSKDSASPVSFASQKNTPNTVQYMLHTPEIAIKKPVEKTVEEVDNRNFFEKFLDLFKPQ